MAAHAFAKSGRGILLYGHRDSLFQGHRTNLSPRADGDRQYQGRSVEHIPIVAADPNRGTPVV